MQDNQLQRLKSWPAGGCPGRGLKTGPLIIADPQLFHLPQMEFRSETCRAGAGIGSACMAHDKNSTPRSRTGEDIFCLLELDSDT
jgi:hypothetical protein